MLEAIIGIIIPMLFTKPSPSRQWYLSCLNCAAGGVFLAAGLVHMIPHCQEAQEAFWLHWSSSTPSGDSDLHDMPLYLMLVVSGFLLVFFVERVLLDVHGEDAGHTHCEHSNVFTHSIYYQALSEPCSLEEQADAGRPSSQDQAGNHCTNHFHNHHGHGHHHHAALAAAVVHRNNGTNGRDELISPLLAQHQHQHQHQALTHPPLMVSEAPGPSHTCVEIRPTFQPLHGAVLLAAMTVHTALESLALGGITDREAFFALFIAIASHKCISALALASRFLKEGATVAQVLTYIGPFTLVAPLSIMAGMYTSHVHPLANLVLMCLATGTFLYVGAGEVIMEEFEGDVRCGRTDIGHKLALYIKFLVVLLAAGAICAVSLLHHDDD